MSKTSEDKTEIVRKIVEHMYERDALAQHFNIQILEVREGYARLSMVVRKEMLNGHGICHGGVTFSLADTAFAYSCNSHNRKTVALNCTISYAQAVFEGDELTAEAKEVILNRRTGTYDVTISNQKSEVIALFRGASYTVKQAVLPEDDLL